MHNNALRAKKSLPKAPGDHYGAPENCESFEKAQVRRALGGVANLVF